MRRPIFLATGAWLFLSGGLTWSQGKATTATVISRQQIVGVLQQKLAGAPQETGGGLLDGDHYRIGALKRKLPGEVEIHRQDTDVLYFLLGSATLLTGGTVVGEHAISVNEERGTAIRGGVRYTLHAGDIMVIPKGQPHWFQAVSGEVSYVVMKIQ